MANLKEDKLYFSLGGFHSMVGLLITLGLRYKEVEQRCPLEMHIRKQKMGVSIFPQMVYPSPKTFQKYHKLESKHLIHRPFGATVNTNHNNH